jgi:hypothetical protein
MEFIDNKNMVSYDDSAQALIKEMETNEQKVKNLIGEKAYTEEMRVLKLIAADDEKKGNFAMIEGDIDTRDASLKKLELSSGFEAACGIRGGKLSGGQK